MQSFLRPPRRQALDCKGLSFKGFCKELAKVNRMHLTWYAYILLYQIYIYIYITYIYIYIITYIYIIYIYIHIYSMYLLSRLSWFLVISFLNELPLAPKFTASFSRCTIDGRSFK